MKIITVTLLILLTITMTGCKPDQSIIQEQYRAEIVHVETDTISSTFLLSVYELMEEPGIEYVNVCAFAYVVRGYVEGVTCEQEEKVKVRYETNQIIEFNSEQNSIYISDFMYKEDIEGEYNYTNNSMDLVNVEKEDVTTSYKIELDDYDIKMIEQDGDVYIPFYLANHFLFGNSVTGYLYKERLYIFNEYSSLLDKVNRIGYTESEYEETLIKHNNNFTKLLFDYSYGLTEHYEIDSTALLHEYNLDEYTDLTEYHKQYYKMIYELLDYHTMIIDFGVRENIENNLLFDDASDEYKQFWGILNGNSCNLTSHEDEVKLFDSQKDYVLWLDGFNKTTKEKLEVELAKINDPNKNLYIDLRCNTGGTLQSLIDVLPYFTDKDIEVHYEVPYLNQNVTMYYESKEEKSIDNFIYVLTSPATFSAGNYFASLIDDYDIGTIIGLQSLGGAASREYVVLPDSMIMTYSTQFVLEGLVGNSIEDGIDPAFETHLYFAHELHEEMTNYFTYTKQIELTNNINNGLIDIDIDFNTNENIEFSHYGFKVVDYETREILQEYYTKNKERITMDITSSNAMNEVFIDAYFYFNDSLFKITLYNEFVDDYSAQINENTVLINLDQEYNAEASYPFGDKDLFQIEITETGNYKALIDGAFSSVNTQFYDSDGEEIEYLPEHYVTLTPGTYYVLFSKENTYRNWTQNTPYTLEVKTITE